jgi:hypothetical protein
MRVEVVRYYALGSQEASAYPRIILERGRNWEDWPTTEAVARGDAYRTLFDVYYEERPSRSRPRPLGSVKILQRGRTAPDLSGVMSHLPEDCCSLGQTIDYYTALDALEGPVRNEVLTTLRDVTANEELAQSFQDEPGFRASLLRFSEAERIFRHRPRRLDHDPPPRAPVSFRFRTQLVGFDEPHDVDFDFFPEPRQLRRLMVVVGENGTGKTQLLARLAWALWGLGRTGEELLPERPPIGRVIAVSYSALDAFERPPHRLPGTEKHPALDNYCYCGFRDADSSLRPSLLFDALEADLVEITRLGRREQWTRMLRDLRLLDGEPDLAAAVPEGDSAVVRAAQHLAAGEKTALSVLTRLLAKLRNRSFVLFDEPELNMHPSLLSAMLRSLHEWMEDFDAYGVVATHSPIVLQETPGQMVRILEREGKVPFLRRYESESFGQSLSEIVVEVFGTDERERNYASMLKALVEAGMTVEEIESSFGRPLSLNARMALGSLARRRRQR